MDSSHKSILFAQFQSPPCVELMVTSSGLDTIDVRTGDIVHSHQFNNILFWRIRGANNRYLCFQEVSRCRNQLHVIFSRWRYKRIWHRFLYYILLGSCCDDDRLKCLPIISVGLSVESSVRARAAMERHLLSVSKEKLHLKKAASNEI